jgi:hypothetical protein
MGTPYLNYRQGYVINEMVWYYILTQKNNIISLSVQAVASGD